MARRALLHRLAAAHPGDTAPLEALMDQGALDPRLIVAILGKTEGNGCVNDFTRAYAVQAMAGMLARRMLTTPEIVLEKVAMVMSGGTEGGLSPHWLVLSVVPDGGEATPGGARLAIGTAFTEPLPPAAIGRAAQAEATAEAVRAAMAAAGIEDPGSVHYVQVKCPLLTSERIAASEDPVVTHDTYASMGFSRGASALGVALALGEIDAVTDEMVLRDLSRFSARAACSAGVELARNEVVVLGMSQDWAGDLVIAHDVMADAIDLDAIRRALAAAGLPQGPGQLTEAEALVAVLAKAEPSTTGRIRGLRHIMNDDSDINATRHARALVGGVVAAATGRTDAFVSGGAEHQGPDGGGPVAIVARVAAAGPPP
ncbi:barbiturase [Humitalea rosea]|uniref:Cyanuric acid amidohydrolase n=1 Tax=Humitalea rosea TaxID=990373 RepID=A0A2W7IGD4_9PROT|nr:ring-opening amidohydrolase [Humitalea rosea]PZW45611.1 barbiturase [Humitalea rosea]